MDLVLEDRVIGPDGQIIGWWRLKGKPGQRDGWVKLGFRLVGFQDLLDWDPALLPRAVANVEKPSRIRRLNQAARGAIARVIGATRRKRPDPVQAHFLRCWSMRAKEKRRARIL